MRKKKFTPQQAENTLADLDKITFLVCEMMNISSSTRTDPESLAKYLDSRNLVNTYSIIVLDYLAQIETRVKRAVNA